MRKSSIVLLAVGTCVFLGLSGRTPSSQGEKPEASFKPNIPKTWDDAAMATLEVPLADPIGSPKHVSADYYYRTPARPIYKQYPVYAPGREPAGYVDWLKQQEPVIVWDGASHRPALQTEADWIKAGEIVFGAQIIPTENDGTFTLTDVTSPAWYKETGMPATPDGVVPFFSYVIHGTGKSQARLVLLRDVPHAPDAGRHGS